MHAWSSQNLQGSFCNLPAIDTFNPKEYKAIFPLHTPITYFNFYQKETDYSFISMVRTPAEHFLSWYYYIKSHTEEKWLVSMTTQYGNDVYDEEKKRIRRFNQQSLQEYLDNPKDYIFSQNSQARHISGITENNKRSLGAVLPDIIHKYKVPNPKNDKALLKLTQKNLHRYDFIGITEEYDLSMLYLCYLHDLPVFDFSHKVNILEDQVKNNSTEFRKVEKEILRASIKKQIEKYNNVDCKIYEEIKTIFWQKVSHPKFLQWLGKTSKSNLHELQIEKHHLSTITPKKDLTINFSRYDNPKIFKDGWRYIEGNLQTEVQEYRWAISKEVSLQPNLTPNTNYVVTVTGDTHHNNPNQIVTINYAGQLLKKIDLKSDSFIFEISPKEENPEINFTFSQCNKINESDLRNLSFVFYKMTFEELKQS